MLEFVLARGNYWLIIALMMTGLYIVFAAQNMIKRLVGLSVFQTSVFLFYITLSKVAGGTAPILFGEDISKGEKGEGAYGDAAAQSQPGYVAPPAAEPAPADMGPDGEATGILQGDGASLEGGPANEGVAETVDNVAGAGAGAYGGVETTLQNVYSNPLPHVLILTAIVVGVATLAVGLAIIVRIREAYGTIEADEVRQIDIEVALAEEAEDLAAGGAA